MKVMLQGTVTICRKGCQHW